MLVRLFKNDCMNKALAIESALEDMEPSTRGTVLTQPDNPVKRAISKGRMSGQENIGNLPEVFLITI